MKKIFPFIYALVICSVLSCEEALNNLTVFEIDNTTEFTVPSSTLISSPIDIGTPAITTNSESEFENNNTRADLIESIKLKSIRLRLTSPDDGDFNFLQEVRIYISADGQDEVEIAFLENIENTDAKEIVLTTTGEELKAFVSKDSYSLRVQATTDETIEANHDIQVFSVFRVDANILGI